MCFVGLAFLDGSLPCGSDYSLAPFKIVLLVVWGPSPLWLGCDPLQILCQCSGPAASIAELLVANAHGCTLRK